VLIASQLTVAQRKIKRIWAILGIDPKLEASKNVTHGLEQN
jgi:hypothetical protein